MDKKLDRIKLGRVTKLPSSSARETGLGCLYTDILKEILSLLSAKTLIRFKCVSKVWENIICDPVFQMVQCQRSEDVVSSLFLIESSNHELIQSVYAPIKDSQVIMQDDILNFLPEKVIMSSSSNGIVCCHNVEGDTLVIYVCNPATKQYLKIEGPKGNRGHYVDTGLAFDPFYSSGKHSSKFNLVCMTTESSLEFSENIFFHIYSSERGKWGTSMEVYNTDKDLLKGQKVFVSGVLYWMITTNLILALDFDKEHCQPIYGPIRESCFPTFSPTCIGESEGRLQFVYSKYGIIRVWLLDCNHKWELVFLYSVDVTMKDIAPVVVKDGILLLKLPCEFGFLYDTGKMHIKFYSLNLGTGGIVEVCKFDALGLSKYWTYFQYAREFSRSLKTLPYRISLVPLQVA